MMNKTEVIAEIAKMTNVSVTDCGKVLGAFEEVFDKELRSKGKKSGILKLIVISSFLLLLAMSAFSQTGILTQNVRGRVVDAASGYPVAYASIYLMGNSGIGAVTDSLGYFVIKQVPIGRHNVQASFVGYEPTIFREILVTSSKEVNLTIPLKECIKELDEVKVRPQLNKEQPLNKMVTTGARMFSVEETSRYAGEWMTLHGW